MLTSSTSATASSDAKQSKFSKALQIEWLAQTAASIFWILGVFAYGIRSNGDWLQLFAGTSWLIANIATLATNKK